MIEHFVNPWMLGGLALMAAPVLIHLLNRRRFRMVDWAAMDFLLEAEAKRRRRVRLEDLLLLLLRMALIALVVFAIARPVLQRWVGSREDERYVVVDDSFSMEATSGAGLPLVAAQSEAARLVEDAVGRGLPFGIWRGTRAEPVSEVDLAQPGSGDAGGGDASTTGGGEPSGIARLAGRGADALRRVRALESTDERTNPALVLARLRERFTGHERPLLRSVVLVSDLRRDDWFGASGLHPEITAEIRAFAEDGDLERTRWRIADVGTDARENLAVTRVRASGDLPVIGSPVRVVVDVVNTGAEERRAVRGWIEVGSPAIAPAAAAGDVSTVRQVSRRVQLSDIAVVPPGGRASASAELQFDAPGDYPITAVVEGTDRLPVDDRGHGVVRVSPGLDVLLVDGDAQPGRFGGEAGYLAAALAPRGTSDSGVRVRVTSGRITDEAIESVRVVMVLNRAEVDREEAAVLRRFVRRGGGLAWFLGNRVRPEAYAELATGPERARARGDVVLFPARLGAPASAAAGERRHLRIVDEEHRGFEVFRGVEGSSLVQVGFDRWFELEPDSRAETIARFDDPAGTPAVVEARAAATADDAESPGETSERRGAVEGASSGRVVIFNLTPDRDWNDWPTDPSFPIVFGEWLRYLATPLGDERRVACGIAISWPWTPGLEYRVELPDGEVRTVSAPLDPRMPDDDVGADETTGEVGDGQDASDDSAPSEREPAATPVRGGRPRGVFSETHEAGFYRVVPSRRVAGAAVRPSALEPMLFACVRDERESRLERTDAEELRTALSGEGMDVVVDESRREGGGVATGGGEMWRSLALIAAAVLLVELLLAWWMGREGS